MKELPNNVIRNCNEKKLLNLKRIVLDYIKEFKLEDITWKSLTKEKMRKFLFDNYYINNNFITWNDNDTIFGMHYLQWHLYTDKYFIGTIKNNIDKETIVGCISYFNYHKIYGNVNYISTVEINYFYQGMKLLNELYKNFINELDLDGNSFCRIMKFPVVIYNNVIFNSDGRYVSINNKYLNKIINSFSFSEEEKTNILENGLIEIDKKYENNHNSMFYVTLVHEILHANRDLLLYDYFNNVGGSEFSNEYAYVYKDGRFFKNTSNLSFDYGDASQNILNGNIDSSKIENAQDELDMDDKVAEKMAKQVDIDEALIDTMSIVANKIYNEKKKGNKLGIFECLELLRDCIDVNNVKVICDIILRHRDYGLFYWVLDPIGYTYGDIHYDFFSNYTKNDGDLVSSFDSYQDFDKRKN